MGPGRSPVLPSISAGGFLVAIVVPYAVRVVPNRIWRDVFRYAFGIGLMGLFSAEKAIVATDRHCTPDRTMAVRSVCQSVQLLL